MKCDTGMSMALLIVNGRPSVDCPTTIPPSMRWTWTTVRTLRPTNIFRFSPLTNAAGLDVSISAKVGVQNFRTINVILYCHLVANREANKLYISSSPSYHIKPLCQRLQYYEQVLGEVLYSQTCNETSGIVTSTKTLPSL